MPNTYVLISSTVLGSTSASVTFSSIPQTYTDLVVTLSLRASTGGSVASSARMLINGTTGSDYFYRMAGTGTTTVSSNAGGVYIDNSVNGQTSTANTYSSVDMYIPSYTDNFPKQLGQFYSYEQAAATADTNVYARYWNSTGTPITALTIDLGGVTPIFEIGSSFYLYGIKKN